MHSMPPSFRIPAASHVVDVLLPGVGIGLEDHRPGGTVGEFPGRTQEYAECHLPLPQRFM